MMSPPSEAEQKANTLREWISDFFQNPRSLGDSYHKSLPPSRKLDILESLYNFTSKVIYQSYHGPVPDELTVQLFPFEVDLCLLWCGVQFDWSLVRYVVEHRDVSIDDILLNKIFKNGYGENAVYVAVQSDRIDVLDCLLAPWFQKPVRTPTVWNYFKLIVFMSGHPYRPAHCMLRLALATICSVSTAPHSLNPSPRNHSPVSRSLYGKRRISGTFFAE
jgi:hypothetical protein